jgi:hypothetical protein
VNRAKMVVAVAAACAGSLLVLAFSVGAATPLGRTSPLPPPPPPPPNVALSLDAKAPDHGWIVKLTNGGTDAIRIVADPRLLSFDVTNAGHDQHCTLPADMTPTTDTERTLVVPAGRSWSVEIDPALYCFTSAQTAALAPGATVSANFGFAAGAYRPPFAVTPISDAGAQPARRISATVVTLAAAFSSLASLDAGATLPLDASITTNPVNAYPVKLKVSLPERLDVSRAFEQSVTVSITNEGDRPLHTLITPPTIGFAVELPSGRLVRCGADTAVSAFAELVSTLAPHGRTAQSIDIGALCGVYMRHAGLYRVRPRLDTHLVAPPPGTTTFWSGESLGPPMLMRIRAGEDPLPPPRLDPAQNKP